MSLDQKIIGKSFQTNELRKFVNMAAESDANVLLLGETGVGKEVAARLIHCQSSRGKNPFLKINCANLSDTLIESELFGYKKGAYTGAVNDKPGLIESAKGGIFFFDDRFYLSCDRRQVRPPNHRRVCNAIGFFNNGLRISFPQYQRSYPAAAAGS